MVEQQRQQMQRLAQVVACRREETRFREIGFLCALARGLRFGFPRAQLTRQLFVLESDSQRPSNELGTIARIEDQVEQREQDQSGDHPVQRPVGQRPGDRERRKKERHQPVERGRNGARNRHAGGAPRDEHHGHDRPLERRGIEEQERGGTGHDPARGRGEAQKVNPGLDARPGRRARQEHEAEHGARAPDADRGAGPAPRRCCAQVRRHHVGDERGSDDHPERSTDYLAVDEAEPLGVERVARNFGVGRVHVAQGDESAEKSRICRCIAAGLANRV